MTEREKAIKIANAMLERAYIDPDCDEMVLARQFLRAIESITALEEKVADHNNDMRDLYQEQENRELARDLGRE